MSVPFVRVSRTAAFTLPKVAASSRRAVSSSSCSCAGVQASHIKSDALAAAALRPLLQPSRRPKTANNSSVGILKGRRNFATTKSTMASSLSEIKSSCRKVVCIGRNYADHVKELNNQRPKQPFFFLKPPSSILLPSDGPVLRPAGVNMHFEIELGLVLGKTLKDVDENDTATWMDAIESYLLTIDMTARNAQEEAKKKGLPWDIAKGFDTFLPIAGPIEKGKITDPHNVELWLSVNGDMKQNDNTELMLFRIGRQLSDISKVMTLEKGDIVLTGTPKGVGPVVTGDVMEAGLRIDGKEVEEARIKVAIEDRKGPYVFAET